MGTLRQEIIATLKSCSPIYHKLYDQAGFQPIEDDIDCLLKFRQLWEARLLDDDEIPEEAGLSFMEMGWLVGYTTELKDRVKGTMPQEK